MAVETTPKPQVTQLPAPARRVTIPVRKSRLREWLMHAREKVTLLTADSTQFVISARQAYAITLAIGTLVMTIVAGYIWFDNRLKEAFDDRGNKSFISREQYNAERMQDLLDMERKAAKFDRLERVVERMERFLDQQGVRP